VEELYVIKIGGNIVDDGEKLSGFLKSFAAVPARKILVHGGGKLATRLAGQLQIPQQMVDGRRITDAETLKIVTMVYAGYINKNIVAALQALDCNAVGICGADGNSLLAHKRIVSGTDYGFAGDIDHINLRWLDQLLRDNMTIVVSPITHDSKGQLLNTNADTIAQEIAKAFSKTYLVNLVYSFEKSGVLSDVNDEGSVIANLNPGEYHLLRTDKKIFAGMIPKLDNAFEALEKGVKKVVIGKGEELEKLIAGTAGTTIRHE
jgi:acetylglutamate kinase